MAEVGRIAAFAAGLGNVERVDVLPFHQLGSWFPDGSGGTRFGIGIGTLVLTANVILLGGYTLSCHSLRHLVGGKLDVLSKAPVRKVAYDCASCLNGRHMVWAWMSLVWVMFSDLYVRMCSMGVWTDWRIL
jgi:hypothetical protein